MFAHMCPLRILKSSSVEPFNQQRGAQKYLAKLKPLCLQFQADCLPSSKVFRFWFVSVFEYAIKWWAMNFFSPVNIVDAMKWNILYIFKELSGGFLVKTNTYFDGTVS